VSTIYTVKSGDSLAALAQHFFGDQELWPRIQQANASAIPNPDAIFAGQQIKIPDLDGVLTLASPLTSQSSLDAPAQSASTDPTEAFAAMLTTDEIRTAFMETGKNIEIYWPLLASEMQVAE
jgi:LysM repeat protein